MDEYLTFEANGVPAHGWHNLISIVDTKLISRAKLCLASMVLHNQSTLRM